MADATPSKQMHTGASPATRQRRSNGLRTLVACLALALTPAAPLAAGENGFEIHQVSPRVFTGPEPAPPNAFATLKEAGVTTVISVDGATPDAEAASAAGLRYIHLPVGYDAIPAPVQAAVAALASDSDQTLYIHCHHGRHRGPVVAAIAALSNRSITTGQASQLLEACGTGAEYVGLWNAVKNYRPLPPGTGAAPLVPKAEIEPLAEHMAALDRYFDSLAEADREGWPDKGTTDQAHDALLVTEGLAESFRLAGESGPADPGERLDFDKAFRAAISNAKALQHAISAADAAGAHHRLATVKSDCRSCHKRFRN